MTSKTINLASPTTSGRRVQVVMMGMLLTLAAAIGVSAWAQPAPPLPGQGMEAHRMEHGGSRGMQGGMHGGMSGMHGGMGGGMGGMMFGGSPERAGKKIDRMLDGLDATDAQRTQIKQIAAAAAADLKTQMQAGRGLRERGMALFTQPTVDAGAVEQLRQQMLQQHDQMSKRAAQAMLDAARVLTPEQRAKLGARMKDRQARMADHMKRMERPASSPR
ncbi:MAG: Spy/CpxP family protein refolding chaperone [Caldimonas sp.]